MTVCEVTHPQPARIHLSATVRERLAAAITSVAVILLLPGAAILMPYLG